MVSFNYTTNKNAEEGYSLPVDYYDGPDRPAKQQDPVSRAYLNRTNARTLTFDAYATFHKVFNEKHDFTAMVGFNQEDWRSNYASASRKELISSSLPTLGLASGDMNVGQSISTLAMRSVFGRLNYTFNNKYILAFNGRYDGTSVSRMMTATFSTRPVLWLGYFRKKNSSSRYVIMWTS